MASAHTGCVHALRPKFPSIPSLRNRIVFGLACEMKLAVEKNGGTKKKKWVHVSTSICLQFKHKRDPNLIGLPSSRGGPKRASDYQGHAIV